MYKVHGYFIFRDPLSTSRFQPSCMPTDHPFNKDSYRYILVESDPHTPGRQAFDESMASSLNKPMAVPAQFYRVFISPNVTLAVQDRGMTMLLLNQYNINAPPRILTIDSGLQKLVYKVFFNSAFPRVHHQETFCLHRESSSKGTYFIVGSKTAGALRKTSF